MNASVSNGRTGGAATLGVGELAKLRATVDGPVLTADDDGYLAAGRLFNAAVEHTPEAIVQVTSAADAAAAMRFARDRGLDVSVRGGGHGVVGHATAGRLVIDLSRLAGVTVDPSGRTTRVGGGATWGGVDTATQEYGLATPGGRVTHTGVGGLTLGGGQGWLSSRYGLTIDNLVEVELVTADGRVVTASQTSEPDLFWAVRGAGANFGVATSFTFGLHEVGPTILGGLLIFTPDKAADLVRAFDEFVTTAPDDFGGALAFMSAPPAPFVPPEAVGMPIAVAVVAWFGDLDAGQRTLAPLRAFGPPMMDLIGPMPYTALQSIIDDGNPFGLRNYWTAGYVSQITDAFIADTVEVSLNRPSPLSTVLLAPMGASVARVSQDATAFGHREARYLFHPLAMWTDPDADEANVGWARRTMAAAAPHTAAGTYLNADGDQTDADRVRFAFGAAPYGRLVGLKRTWDPDNVFHHNANIDPTAQV